jgi:hypothetical protein
MKGALEAVAALLLAAAWLGVAATTDRVMRDGAVRTKVAAPAPAVAVNVPGSNRPDGPGTAPSTAATGPAI